MARKLLLEQQKQEKCMFQKNGQKKEPSTEDYGVIKIR